MNQLITTRRSFGPHVVLDFYMRCTDYGISVPFMPGIMCLNGLADLERIVESASHDFQDV